MKKLLAVVILLPLLGFVVLASGKTEGMSLPLKRTMTEPQCSPENLNYDMFAPYCVAVERMTYLFATKCQIAIVKERDMREGGYGYRQDLEGPCVAPQSIDWETDGVAIHYPDRKITVPAASFTGGR